MFVLWEVYTMSILYIIAGVFHFLIPKIYKSIVPSYIPFPNTIVFLSGIIEVVLGIAILFNEIRIYALWGIIIMLILFFPVHLFMLTEKKFTKKIPKWVLIIRIPIQFILIYWAYSFI